MSWGTFDDYASEKNFKASGNGPYAVYFCSEQIAQTAGIGTEAIRAKIKAGIKPVKDTIFEQNGVLDAFKKAGINEFFKVSATKDNINLAKKYKVAQDNTLILCSPKGGAVVTLSGDQCTYANVMKVLKLWNEIYADWNKKEISHLTR